MQEERVIAFDAPVLRSVERQAALAGRPLSEVVNATLRDYVARVAVAEGLEGAPADAYSAAYLQALLDRDAPRARSVAEAAVAAAFPIAEVYAAVITPALTEIGHLWAIERITVAQEHFATTLTQSLLARLAPEARTAPSLGRLAVVTATPGELHVLGALMAADLLEREGWEVISLGASTPADDLVDLVERECPDVVALSTTTVGRLHGFTDVVTRLHAVEPRPFLVVGGGLFSGEIAGTAQGLGADLVVTDVRDLIPELTTRLPAPADGDDA